MLIPGWALPLRSWKSQIPYLARHFRVIAYDPRGTGRSDRPIGSPSYALDELVADAVAVMDAVGAPSSVVVGKSRGTQTALALAANHSGRVDALVTVGSGVPMSPWLPVDLSWLSFEKPAARSRRRVAYRRAPSMVRELARSQEFRRFTNHVSFREAARTFSRETMLDDFPSVVQWFMTQLVATESHSTKQIDDLTGWLTATGPQVAADAYSADCLRVPADARALCERVSCPVLVIHGDRDIVVPLEWGRRLAELTGGKLLVVPGAGHLPVARYPVLVNLAVLEFVDSLVGAPAS
jgi:pimeloyl-ACP methyl ester carboxylesterase